MSHSRVTTSVPSRVWHCVVALLVGLAMAAVAWAPTERTMGDAQRVLYIHVAVAWLGLCGYVFMAGTGVAYLLRRDLAWDRWSQAAGELSWLCCSLTLITGSLWARAAWGTWWTWDPRLLTAFVLWALCCGYLLVRTSIPDLHQRARLSAVLAIIGVLDVPLVIMATRWFRTIHPVSPQMEPEMRMVLLASVCSFTTLFATLLVHRWKQIGLEHAVSRMEWE